MNTAQTNLYRRTWQAASVALGWNTKAKREAALASHHAGVVWVSPELNKLLATIYELAQLSAHSADRDVSADDLRHAVTAVALQRNCSSKSFTNADLDKVLALLRLLANPTDLHNLNAFTNSEAGERRRHVHVITSAAERYWKSIAADKFGHADLDQLAIEQLRQLSLTIRNRRPASRAESLPQLATV